MRWGLVLVEVFLLRLGRLVYLYTQVHPKAIDGLDPHDVYFREVKEVLAEQVQLALLLKVDTREHIRHLWCGCTWTEGGEKKSVRKERTGKCGTITGEWDMQCVGSAPPVLGHPV